jgi:NAD(P)-dependent dehydrogenase (short-subunit alcohol dehydrogenase family)
MLEGKRIVVTGSGQGIGSSCARLMARLGASVVINDIDVLLAESVAEEIAAAGGRAIVHACDITNEQAATELIDHCVKEFGGIDGLMNNAALFRLSPLLEQPTDDLRKIIEVNVLGTMFCARRAAHHMVKDGAGAILNVTSGAHLGYKDQGAYGASKGAVASFTYTWAIELREAGIRVNALSPRAFTGMSKVQADFRTARNEPVTWSGKGDLSPDVNAPTAAFLLSDAASDITGQVVRIDGDNLALYGQPVLQRPEGGPRVWTMEVVAEAFETVLKRHLSPFGISSIRSVEVS